MLEVCGNDGDCLKNLHNNKLTVLLLLFAARLFCQTSVPFHNPVLFADYSDPDAIRDGNHYYLIASSFHFVPGIPILESTDLVHWTILGHAVARLEMDPRYDLTAGSNGYGMGVWAPAIRKYGGLFYIYFPTPTEGIFVTTARRITGPWTKPQAVIAQAGLEDPCPFWDDDGNAYLVHGKKGAGPLVLHRMSPDGMHVLDGGKVIVDDHEHLPTLEGPKLYKRNGWYYIFAPFGGVGTGKQVVLRAHNLYGPWEQRVVLAQGNTKINGPHQGAYVETPSGKGWFLHFQSRGAHGRIVHLEPVRWKDDWPIVGEVVDGGSVGQPIASGVVIGVRRSGPSLRPQTSDEFNGAQLGPQWEWNHNPDDTHWSLTARRGFLRLIPTHADSLLHAHNTLTQCMQDNSFEFTTRVDLSALHSGTHVGLAMFETAASALEIVQTGSERKIQYVHQMETVVGPRIAQVSVQLRVRVDGDKAAYFFSTDEGASFQPLGPVTPIHFSWWKGARPALFAYTTESSDSGAVDFDWVRYQALGGNPW